MIYIAAEMIPLRYQTQNTVPNVQDTRRRTSYNICKESVVMYVETTLKLTLKYFVRL